MLGHYIYFRRQGEEFIELNDDLPPTTLTSIEAHQAFEGASSQSCVFLYIRS